jgi:hypothetical protein
MARRIGGIVLIALLASAASGAGCKKSPAGGPCASTRDCVAGLLCDPATRTCRVVSGGSDAAPGTDAAATDAAPGIDAAPGTDAVPGTDAGTDAAPSLDASLPGGGETGAPCTGDADCLAASATSMPICGTESQGLPGGYCSNQMCNVTTQDCPGADAVCYEPFPGMGSACLDTCDPALAGADCRAGYSCIDFAALIMLPPGGPYICYFICMTTADCPTGTMCEPTTSTCQ